MGASCLFYVFNLLARGTQPHSSDRDLSPVPEQQLHAPGVHVEFAGSFIVLHVCVLSALRHLYSCDLCDTVFLLIRFRTHSGWKSTFVLLSEKNKKSEPFSYREKVRIFIVWCTADSTPASTASLPLGVYELPHGLFLRTGVDPGGHHRPCYRYPVQNPERMGTLRS